MSKFATAARVMLVVLFGCGIAVAQPKNEGRKQRPIPSNAYDQLKEALEAKRQGDLARAASLFAVAQKSKDFASARPPVELILAVGDYYFGQSTPDSYSQALDTYDLVVTVYGKDSSPFQLAMMRFKRAEVLGWKGKAELARNEIDAIRKSVKNDRRSNLIADLAGANLQLLANQADAARDALLPLIELNDDVISPSALFSLGRAYVQLKQPEEAVHTFRQLWSRYGESEFVKQAVYLIGKVYFDRGDFMEARKLYEACAVVGAAMQWRVRVGDELIVKVSDHDYFARTRSQTLSVAIKAPSGDLETLRLEKNPVSDQLYVGRIQTALLLPKPGDGQLQVSGNDVIEISYTGLSGKPYQVQVVDDGAIYVDSVALQPPPPRHERTMAKSAAKPGKSDKRNDAGEAIVIPTGKVGSGAVSPGSPIYVQIADGDLDTTDQPDSISAEAVASLQNKETDIVKIRLTETGPRTGVFTGIASTEPLAADGTASSELEAHRAYLAIDDNNSTFWKPKPNADKQAEKHFLEINLRQPAELATLTWGPGATAMANAPTAMRVILRGDDTDVTLNVEGKPKATDNVVDLKKTFARVVRLEFDNFGGDAPAIGQIIITDAAGNRLIPTGVDPSSPDRNDKLAFDVGHQIFARYVDDENETPGRSITRQSRNLGVRYHDASVSLAVHEGDDSSRRLIPAWRLDRAGRQSIIINDADADTTTQPDSLKIMVYTEAGDSQELAATETGPATGVFAAALPLAVQADAKENPRLLYMAEGDLLWMSYLDDRNMTPGYRTFRHNWVIDNRPTVGDLLPQPLVTTAWPFEVTPTGDGEMQAVSRTLGRGRVTIQYADPDAFPKASATATAKINALLSDTSTEIVLRSSGDGTASRQLDLILGDKETASRVDAAQEDSDEPKTPNMRAPRVSNNNEISVAGDDIVRIAVQDEHIGSSDSSIRQVMDEQSLKSYLTKPNEDQKDTLPTIKLSDPIRRMTKTQQDRLADLKAEMGLRLLANRMIGEQLAEYTKTIEARIAKTPANSEIMAVLRRQQVAVASATELNNNRLERLKALGAVEAKAFPATRPAEGESAANGKGDQTLVDGPIIPDRPFVVTINDADLTGEKVEVRVRSLSGRLVQSQLAQADRQPDGTYKAVIQTQRSSEKTASGALAVLPGGSVLVEYRDNSNPAGVAADRVEYLALAGDATIRSLNANYVDDVSQIRLGQQVYLEITDRDGDRGKNLDTILTTAVSSRGDKLQVMCTETEPHSGVFRGTFVTDFADPIAGDDILQAGYGETASVFYNDYLRQSSDSPIQKSVSIRIRGGSDGRIEAFSRQFQNSKEEMQLWYRTGEAAYQVGRKLYLAGAIARAEEYLSEATDYFQAVADRFPDDPLAASSNYYLGNIQSLRGRHREALVRFQEVVSRWPKSEFIARARFKIGQAYESLGQFDLAADAYVLLTYHHPQDENVPLAMIRMMNHYARGESWSDAVGIAQRFVAKFPTHEQSGAVALKAGQWLTVSGNANEALAWYTSVEKTFASSDRDMPALLYWHAATMIQGAKVGRNGERADKIRELLNRVVYDYGKSEYSSLAKVALDQLNQNN